MSDGNEFIGPEKINHLAGIVQLDADQLRSHVTDVVRTGSKLTFERTGVSRTMDQYDSAETGLRRTVPG